MEKLRKPLAFILALIIVFSININITDISPEVRFISSINFGQSNSYVWIIIVLFVYLISEQSLKIKDKRLLKCSAVLAILLATMSVIGEMLNTYLDLSVVLQSNKLLLYCIIKWIGNILLLYIGTTTIFSIINNKLKENIKIKNCKFFEAKPINLFIYWGIIFIAYIPYLLAYYPGIITPDSLTQLSQTVGIYPLSNHHPIMHTFVIGIFIQLGKIFGNYNIGVAIYSIVQMLALSGIFAYTIYYMSKKNVPILLRIITLVFYAIYPIHSMYSITMWKDIPFAICMLWFVILINEMVTNKEQFFKSKKKLVLFAISMLLVILFRNNGIYVVILTAPFIFIFAKQYYKQLIIIFACVLLTYSVLWKGIIFNCLKIEEGSAVEALSVPLQQIARVVRDKKDKLTEEEKVQINKLWEEKDLAEIYDPTLSDNVKGSVNVEELSNNKGDFIKLWLGFVIKYPMTCIEAFLCNCYGYWYPEASNWVVSRVIVEPQIEKQEELNLHQTPLIKGKFVKEIDSYIDKRNAPILSMLFSIGFAMWLVFAQIAYIIYKKQYKLLLIFAPILFLWLTNLASPVFCEFRYIYSLFTCLPILLFVAIPKNEN